MKDNQAVPNMFHRLEIIIMGVTSYHNSSKELVVVEPSSWSESAAVGLCDWLYRTAITINTANANEAIIAKKHPKIFLRCNRSIKEKQKYTSNRQMMIWKFLLVHCSWCVSSPSFLIAGLTLRACRRASWRYIWFSRTPCTKARPVSEATSVCKDKASLGSH